VLLYSNQYSHRLQLHLTHPASAFPIRVLPNLNEKIRLHINMIVATQPQQQRFALSGQHYAAVALYFMKKYRYRSSFMKWVLDTMPIFQSLADQHLHFRPCRNADMFNLFDEDAKRKYSEDLSTLLCIAHVLPLAQRCWRLVLEISGISRNTEPFHAKWTLDGWNDHIIQPARDAVLEYYWVRSKAQLYNGYSFNGQFISDTQTKRTWKNI